MFTKGDKYIQITKYGGVNRGEVESFDYTVVYSFAKGVSYKKWHIRTTQGVAYEIDGTDGQFYKVEREFTPEECEVVSRNLQKLSEWKTSNGEKFRKRHLE